MKNKNIAILISFILLIASTIFAYFVIGLSIFEYKINLASISIIYPTILFLLSLMFLVFSVTTFKKEFKKNEKIGISLITFSLLIFAYKGVKLILSYTNGNGGGWLGFLFIFLICLYLLLMGLRFNKGE